MSIDSIKEYVIRNQDKLVLLIGFLLVSLLSFEAGTLWGQKWQQKPLVIEKQVDIAPATESPNVANSEASESIPTVKSQAQGSETSASSCVYVGSKNSTKFYLSTCPWAKQIKPENVVCFKTKEEAIGQGRKESICN